MNATAIRAAIEAAYAAIPADPALALQAAVRDRLASSETLTAIIPPRLIANRQGHPNEYPCITFSDPQIVAREIVFSRRHADVSLDLHIWTQEGGTIAARQLAAIVRAVLFSSPLTTPEIDLAQLRYVGTRVLRDPSGDHGHAVVSLEALAGWRQ